MIVRISRRAFRDISRITDYLGVRSPDASIGFEAELQDALDLLAAFPTSGRAMERKLRRLVLT